MISLYLPVSEFDAGVAQWKAKYEDLKQRAVIFFAHLITILFPLLM